MNTSVVVSTYNGEKYIEEQLRSILNQTVAPDEVLIGDDCSTDSTPNIIENFIVSNSLYSWQLIRNDVNLGWKRNFAQLICKASKDIIFLCDQDDVWYLDKIETTLGYMASGNEELVVSNLDVWYESDSVEKYEPKCLGNSKYQKVKLTPERLRIMRPGCAFAVRREFAQKCFSSYVGVNDAHDVFLWQCAFACDSIGYINKTLMKFNRLDTSTTGGRVDQIEDFRIIENNIFLECITDVTKVFDSDLPISQKAKMLIEKCVGLETNRQKLFATGKMKYWFACLLDIAYYPFWRSCIADLAFVMKTKR